jgi:hemolysin activation/secretion protein
VPFVDVGRGWNQHVSTPDPTELVSIGLRLRWAATFGTVVPLRPQFEVFWGYQLKDEQTEGGNLQDKGVHLRFVLAAF